MPYMTIDGYEIDGLLTEDHSLESEITEYPVESGGDVTDHIRRKPRRYVCEGVVSDTPLGELVAIREAQGGRPSEMARAHFEDIHERRARIIVATAKKRYENMVMETCVFPENEDTGEALRFRATFKQIRMITNERTTVRVAVPIAKKKVNRGNKPAKPATPSKKTYTQVKVYKDTWLGQISQRAGLIEDQGSGTEMQED